MNGEQTGLFRLYGKAPYRAVVLHGGPGAPGCAAGLCRGLEGRIGAVEHLQRAHDIGGLTEELASLIDAHCAGRAVLIGHSFGAWLALLFAEKYPEKTEKVVLIGCGPLDAKYLPKLIETRQARRAAGLSDTDNYCALPGSGCDMLFFDEAQHISLMKEIGRMRECGELARIAGSVSCPVTAIHGLYDPHPLEGVTSVLAGRENFRLIPLEECGHDPWKEKYAREHFFKALREEICIAPGIFQGFTKMAGQSASEG